MSSSEASTKLLESSGIEVYELNDVNEILVYVDGADEVDKNHNLIKAEAVPIQEKRLFNRIK